MKQILLKVELLDYNLDNFPEVVLPTTTYKAHRLFFDHDENALDVIKLLASRFGLDEIDNEKNLNN